MSSTPRKSSFKNNLTKTLLALLIAFSLFWPIKSYAIPVEEIASIPNTIGRILDKIGNLLKEQSALIWKQTQLYFGTRLAHDAAVYLASGGRGQSSFIWNWDEVKELADGAAGEFLDDLSQTYFGKSACVPGDLGVQVQIDLNARALIGEAMDYATASIPNVCEAICSRTAPGSETTTRKVAGVGGDVASLFGPGMDASEVNKDLAEYDKAVDDLINGILDSEEEMSRSIGQYIFEQVKFTLDTHLILAKDPDSGEYLHSINYFYEKLPEDHGPRFADLVKNILDEIGVDTLEEVAIVFENKDISYFSKIFDTYWDKNSLEDALGLAYLVEGTEYVAGTESPVFPKDSSTLLLLDFFNEAYFLFNKMKSAPAAAIDLEPLLEMIGSDDAPIPQVKEYLRTTNGVLENSKISTDKGLYYLETSIFNSLSDKIFSLSDEVIALKTEIMTTHGADLDELVKSYQNFSQCVQACERGQIAEPHGACTLSEIKKQEGFGGVTGIEGGVTGTMDLGPFGSVTDSWQEGTAIGKGRDEHAQEMKEGARLTVADLQDLSTIGDPANNPLGQMLQIAEKSQRQSEEAKERELEESKRAFASDKDLVSGTIKMPGSQVEGRLTGALADIRAANNEYTDSILAQMWGVFFNTLIKEFQEKLYGQGLQPKVYGGPFDPTTRRAYGEGIEAAKEQFSKFANPNITAGGEMNAEILTRLTNCDTANKDQWRFDECIINNHFKDAIEQRMTLDEAVKKNLVRGVFGFHKNGNQPIVGQGIPYNSMIVLRKYRIIPASWEAAAIWVRDVANKEPGSKDVTIEHVMAGYKDKTSPYFGLVNPGWVLKLPLFQCARKGAGEEIVSQSPMPYDSYFSEEGDFTVNISRMNDYCGDAKSCIREKNDGTGCEANSYGHCTVERDFWRFPSEQCKDEALYKTCQAYIGPNNQSVAYLDQTLNLDECNEQSDGCQGYVRDYSWSRLTGGVSPRIDGLSDNAFTFAPDRFAFKKCAKKSGQFCYFQDTTAVDDGCNTISTKELCKETDKDDIKTISNDIFVKQCTIKQTNPDKEESCYFLDTKDDDLCNTFSLGQCSETSVDNPTNKVYIKEFIAVDQDVFLNDAYTGKWRDWLPDPAIYSQNIILNPLGVIDLVPTLWQCFNYDPEAPEQYIGESCFYERAAGRKEGCKLPSGAYCDPWKVETTPNAKTVLGASSVNPVRLINPAPTPEYPQDSGQLYWCGLPGGAGCFVGQEAIGALTDMVGDPPAVPPKMVSNPVDTVPSPYHTTSAAGVQCVVGAWRYEGGEYVFYAVPDFNKTAPLTCSLYRQSLDQTRIGDKRVYLTGNAKQCSIAQAGCQEYFGVEFPSNEYTDSNGQLRFLTAGEKKEFTEKLWEKGLEYYEDLKEQFDYADIFLSEIMPQSLVDKEAAFENEPQIVRKPLNYQRQYCTEKDIDCRKYYPATGAEALAGILDPRKDLCPAQCVGYAHYKEPITPIESRLGTSIVIDDNGDIKAEDRTKTIDRYFIADREEQCPAKSAGCEYFMYKPNDAPSAKDLYLTDLRLCVNTKYPAINRAVYTIIESAAKGATNPVNIELVKSNYTGAVYYKISGEQVLISNIDFNCSDDTCGQLYVDGYHAPCITMDPKGQGSNPDLWQCTDNKYFDEIKPALERCLTVKTLEDKTKHIVSNLAKAECREYIYFPTAEECASQPDCGAERYALPNDLPIRVSDSCTAFKRGGAKSSYIYNIDPDSEVLENMRCEKSSVSCREYLGAGSSITGKLSWVDFEDVTKWGKREDGKIVEDADQPKPTKNVNDIEAEALEFTVNKDYLYNILQEPLDPANSEKLFRDSQTGKVKSFKLSLWAQATKDVIIHIGLQNHNGSENFDFHIGADDGDFYKTSDSEWHYIVFNQISELNFVPHYLYVKSNNADFSLDSIVLEDSASVFRKQRELAFVGKDYSIASHVDKDCNTNFDADEPQYDPNDPFPYQLSCQAYTTDNNQPISFKANTVDLCKDEAVGCQALINTFNTKNPAANTYWPRGKDTEGKDPSGYDDYFVSQDSIEYAVANPSAQCDQIGCILLGREVKDQAGKVTGFEEKYLIDDPLQYQDPNQPTACLIKEQSCQLYKTKETGTPKRFKSPNPFFCEWTTPDSEHEISWYKSVDEKGKLEYCDPWSEQLDPAIDLEIRRPRGFCVEQYTNRPVLDPEDNLTTWCDPNEKKKTVFQIERDATQKESKAQHINSVYTCLDFIDDPIIDEDGDGAIDNDLISGINDGINELKVECQQTVAKCPVDQSQCTWFKDPLESGLSKNYFQIHPDQQDVKGCGQTVNDDLGCRLFNDTEEGGPLVYNAEKSWESGSLKGVSTGDCGDAPLPACDANVLMRVKRDRACGEWLSCKSAMTTGGDKKETVCLDVKPCNVRSADGECVNFVGDAKQSFTNKEIAQSKELFSRAGRLSGYSNMGYEWLRCSDSSLRVKEDKKGDVCVTQKECLKLEEIYISKQDLPATACKTKVQDAIGSQSCERNICGSQTSFAGKTCQSNLDCYQDSDLYFDEKGACMPLSSLLICGGETTAVKKPGFKSLDHINQIGQHAEVVNGDFENAVFDVKDKTTNKETYPVGWEYTYCDINKCQVTKRYESTNPSAERSSKVWRGKYSFLISGNAGKFYAVEQIIENVIPDSIYTVSGWLKVQGGDKYSGIEIDQLKANGDYVGDYDCNDNNRSPSNSHCLISSGTKESGWEYFVKKIATQPETRQLRVRLANTGNSTAIFDDIQVRAHIEALPGEYIAPSCRLYPGENSLNCDALDNNNNLIRGWRGYCVEPDPRWNSSNPRWTNQCVSWWPIDVISGETNVLGTIDETGYLNAPTPLHYCLETMDKEPGMPLPRLICVAKNDVSGLGGEAYKYEACKIVALASDPKPKFYGLGDGDWRLGVDANSFGELEGESAGESSGYKVRMVLGGEEGLNEMSKNPDEHDMKDSGKGLDMNAFSSSGLCILTPQNSFVGDDESPSCVQGCFLVEELSGWGNADKNRGIKTFWQGPNQQKAYGGCVWSTNSNWTECAQNLEQYYHKVAYFAFTEVDGDIELSMSDTAGCWEDGDGDRVYALIGNYYSKSAYPQEYHHLYLGEVSEQTDITNPWYNSPSVNRNRSLIDFARDLTDSTLLEDSNHPYYIFDNFESVTRGRLNKKTWVQRKSATNHFENFQETIPRLGRPEQCKIMAQTVDVSGHNKAWFNKVQTGAPLDPPLDYDRTSYMCIPFGSAPYIRTPNDIMIEPYNKEDGQKMSPVQAPLELYHPENPENKDVGLMCKENYRGQGFYACGGLCNVCAGGDRDGSFCMSDEECGSGTCGLQSFTAEKSGLVCAGKSAVEGQFIGKTIPAQYPYVSWTKPVACLSNKECQEGLMFSDVQTIDNWMNHGVCVGDKFPATSTMYCRASAPNDPLNQFCYQNGGECIKFHNCRDSKDIETPIIDDPEGKIYYKQSEPGISAKPESGLRRLQNIFAKIFKVWEWIKVEDENLKKKAGIDTGYYREMEDEDLDSILGSKDAWSKARDIANLQTNCSIISGTPIVCEDFPGCKTAQKKCIPTSASTAYYRDFEYCDQLGGQNKCAEDSVKCMISTAEPTCIPYQNQYPEITDIKIDKKTDQIVLYEDDRNVNLEFKITAIQEQKPIVMVLIDWDDNTKTALSGIAWDDKDVRSFTHTYAYYPEGASGAPLGCKRYNGVYECRFRPRIKVVDNWGWCNGQKLQTGVTGVWKDLEKSDVMLTTDEEQFKIQEGEGLSWGYYDADCFIQEYIGRCDIGPYIGNKCIDDGNCGGYTCADPSDTADSRYGMQSWDYFGGYVKAEPGADRPAGTDNPPEIYLSFYDINGQIKLDHTELNKQILAKLECKDDYGLINCFVMDASPTPDPSAPQWYGLATLNNRAKTECIGQKSCVIWQDSQFINAGGEWRYTLTVSDDADPPNSRSFDHSFPVVSSGPTISLLINATPIDDYEVLEKGPDYLVTMFCQSGDPQVPLKSCQLNQAASDFILKHCVVIGDSMFQAGSESVWEVNLNKCGSPPVVNCSGGLDSCEFEDTGIWKFDLTAQNNDGNRTVKPYQINVVSP